MTFLQKYRDRRNHNRRARAIERALDRCPSRAMRDELLNISSRY